MISVNIGQVPRLAGQTQPQWSPQVVYSLVYSLTKPDIGLCMLISQATEAHLPGHMCYDRWTRYLVTGGRFVQGEFVFKSNTSQ